jgi:hypothetical protein
MKSLYFAFKDALGDYILVRRRQDPRWAPPRSLVWAYDNLGWVQAVILFAVAAGLVVATGGHS